jgi:hypothetical protein
MGPEPNFDSSEHSNPPMQHLHVTGQVLYRLKLILGG